MLKIYGISFCLLAVFLVGCTTPASMTEQTSSSALTPLTIATNPFLLTGAVRDTKTKAARIYIEGDGRAWLSRNTPSRDPTPPTPTALNLAKQDNSGKTVIYLARPCQYTGLASEGRCPSKYWRSARFSEDVIAAYMQALDQLKATRGIVTFELVGYSGGAAVAAILASRRADVKSLMTVAGNIDTDTHSRLHNVSLLAQSINPVTIAPQLSRLPQVHFIGAQDTNVPKQISDSFTSRLNNTNCTKQIIVPDVTHNNGWENNWPRLLQNYVPACSPAQIL